MNNESVVAGRRRRARCAGLACLRTLALLAAMAWAPGMHACAAAQDTPERFRVNPHRAWFQPALTANADPACDKALHAARQAFFSVTPEYTRLSGFQLLSRMNEGGGEHDPRISFTKQDWRQFVLRQDGKPPLYGYFARVPGCGGACESETLMLSDKPFPPDTSSYGAGPATEEATPEWDLLRSRNGAIYAAGIIDRDRLQLYRLASPDLKLACEIALAPKLPPASAGTRLRSALREVDALIALTHSLSGREGNMCGSMHTLTRWRGDIQYGLNETVWRPWALTASRGDPASENSYGDYGRIEQQFTLWSLGSPMAYREHQQYQAQLKETLRALAAFYAAQYGWPRARALSLAEAATKNAIANGFGFYLYDPYPYAPEIRLRTAILERRPMAQIRAIDFDPDKLSTDDSILDIAVTYPEALAYLLKRGLDVNAANAFGKTPLMYAAQENQLAAVRLLLEAGANPNTATVQPSDSCNYTLSTTHVTALHYAARYGSPELIAALVRGGAATYAQAQTDTGEHPYPLDWLRRYTAPAAGDDRNPNISGPQVEDARKLLDVPDTAARARIAANAVARAESVYGKGDAEGAYRLLQIALAAQPDSQKAISDLPLVALKAGHIGPALRASSRARSELHAPALQASAWFNLGLICEKLGVRTSAYDTYGCDDDVIQPFLHAWETAPTSARANKLRGFFAPGTADTCTFSSFFSGERRVHVLTYRDEQRLYILHPARQDIDPATITWTVKFFNRPEPTVLTPRKVGKTVLGDDAITELAVANYGKKPVIDGRPWCQN